MSTALPTHLLVHDRYRIETVIASGERGGVYRVRDTTITDRAVILKEMIPPLTAFEDGRASLSGTESRISVEARFIEAMERLSRCEHPYLPRIMDYFVESRRLYVVTNEVVGTTLGKALLAVPPPSATHLVHWMAQICDALDCLKKQPRPINFEALSPSHVVIDRDRRARLINFGLGRFADVELRRAIFAETLADHSRDYFRFGELMLLLVMKLKGGTVDEEESGILNEMLGLAEECMAQVKSPTFVDFKQVQERLERLVESEPAAVAPRIRLGEERVEAAAPVQPRGLLARLGLAFLHQPVAVAAYQVTLAALLLLAGLLVTMWPHGIYLGLRPRVYVACGSELWTISQEGSASRVLEHRRLSFPVTGLAGAWSNGTGGTLYVADGMNSRIALLDMLTNEPFADPAHESSPRNLEIPVLPNPAGLALSVDDRVMYVAHPTEENVSVIDLAQRVTLGLIPSGPGPEACAASPDGRLLVIVNREGASLKLVDPVHQFTIAIVPLHGSAQGLCLSGVRRHLYVAVPEANEVVDLDYSSLSAPAEGTHRVFPTHILEDLGGRGPMALALSPNEAVLYVGNSRSGTVGCVDLDTGHLLDTLKVGGDPQELAVAVAPNSQYLGSLWVNCPESRTLVDVDPAQRRILTSVKVGPGAAHMVLMR